MNKFCKRVLWVKVYFRMKKKYKFLDPVVIFNSTFWQDPFHNNNAQTMELRKCKIQDELIGREKKEKKKRWINWAAKQAVTLNACTKLYFFLIKLKTLDDLTIILIYSEDPQRTGVHIWLQRWYICDWNMWHNHNNLLYNKIERIMSMQHELTL